MDSREQLTFFSGNSQKKVLGNKGDSGNFSREHRNADFPGSLSNFIFVFENLE